jgi:hypothetical protein
VTPVARIKPIAKIHLIDLFIIIAPYIVPSVINLPESCNDGSVLGKNQMLSEVMPALGIDLWLLSTLKLIYADQMVIKIN